MGEEEERLTGGDPPGPGDQGKHCRCFPSPLGLGKPVGLLALVPCSGAPSGRVGPSGIGGRWGEEEERPMGRDPLG